MIPDYPLDQDVMLVRQGHLPASVHRFDNNAAVALRAAEACGRPLLIRGKPGVGKSQTARAAAVAAGRPFLSVVIDGRSEAQDLMWRFDAVRRLADAQALRRGGVAKSEDAYVRPEALWWAYDWVGALRWQKSLGQTERPPVEAPAKWAPGVGRAVLLIDEIDKADPDLPNALLDVLANNGFQMPFGHGDVHCAPEARPLIVITTNEEREMPAAFLRRCLVLTLELPEEEKDFCIYLEAMGQRHQALRQQTEPGFNCQVLAEAAKRLWAARNTPGDDADYQPGLAEYLDLVTALARLYQEEGEQLPQLKALARLTYRKR